MLEQPKSNNMSMLKLYVYVSENGLVERNKEDAWGSRSDVDFLKNDRSGGCLGLSKKTPPDPKRGPRLRKEK